jgi:hypothetical protein
MAEPFSKQEDTLAKCWEQRGCDAEMEATCVHAETPTERCPSRCNFAQCDRPSAGVTSDPGLIFSPDVDRTAAIKETCLYCGFFLVNGPRIG